MIRSNQGPLNVAQHGVHPPETLCPTTLRTAAGDNWLVFVADVLHGPEDGQPVGVDHGSKLQMVLHPVAQFLLEKVCHVAHLHRHRLSLLRYFDGRDNDGRTAPALASMLFSTQIRVVQPHDTP